MSSDLGTSSSVAVEQSVDEISDNLNSSIQQPNLVSIKGILFPRDRVSPES